MKVLRIQCYQETACYTKPFANKVAETYPLPPYSTVKGMIHSVMGATELLPFSLSIQGTFNSRIVDYRKTYMVKKKEFAMPIILDGLSSVVPSYDTNIMSSMPLYTHMLYDVYLVIHIRADEDLLQQIQTSVQTNDQHLSLGRYEDLLRIDNVTLVDLHEVDEPKRLKHSVYIPKHYIEDSINGIPYRLNWTYTIKNNNREWTRIPVVYVNKDQILDNDDFIMPIYVDKDDNVVFWNEK